MKYSTKRELKRRLSDTMRKGLTDTQVADLIDTLWRDRTIERNHLETGGAQAESALVSFQYGLAFSSAEHYLSVQAFRLVTLEGRGEVRQEIPYHDLIQTQEGFSLVLSEHEPGDRVRYYACEQT